MIAPNKVQILHSTSSTRQEICTSRTSSHGTAWDSVRHQGEDVVDYAYVAVENGDAEYFAHPVRLGTNGVEEILSYGELSAFEEKAKNDMLETLKKDIKEGVDFMA